MYIEQNRGSITNYGVRYREGKRIASTAAEASVNNLVARRMDKKLQMRWSERGASLTAVIFGSLPIHFGDRRRRGRPHRRQF